MNIANIIATKAIEWPLKETVDATRFDFCLYGIAATRSAVSLHLPYAEILTELHAIEDGLAIITNRHAAEKGKSL